MPPKLRVCREQSGAAKIRSKTEPESVSMSPARRKPSGSPSRRRPSASPNRPGSTRRPQLQYRNFASLDLSPSPRKQQKTDVTTSKNSVRKLDFAPTNDELLFQQQEDPVVAQPCPSRLHEPGHLPEIDAEMDALADQVENVISFVLGKRKRPLKKNDSRRKRKDSDSQMDAAEDGDDDRDADDDDESDAVPHKKFLDFHEIAEAVEEMDTSHNQNTTFYRKANFELWAKLLEYSHLHVVGPGSKVRLLNEFVEYLDASHTVVVNGFSQTLTTRAILQDINEYLKLKISSVGMKPVDYAARLGRALAKSKEVLVLVIHNFDGPSLRDPSQYLPLLRLFEAAGFGLRVMVSTDLDNVALLWNRSPLDTYQFTVLHVDVRDPYDVEVMASDIDSTAASSGAKKHTIASLSVFWQALQPNTQRILALITLMAAETANSVEFNDLFNRAKKQMIVRTPANLKQCLTEFVDHHIVTTANDVITLTVDRNLLLAFLEDKNVDVD